MKHGTYGLIGWIVLLGLTFLLSAIRTGQAATYTKVLQQGLNGFNGFTDASLNKGEKTAGAANTNYGSSRELDVAIKGQCPLCHTSQALIRFELTSIPENAVVKSAKLDLYYIRRGEGTNPSNLIIYRAKQGWNEATVTWNNSWNNYVSGVLAKRYCVGLETAGKWVTLTITDAVRKIVDGTYPNYGFMLAREGLINAMNGEQYYVSSEYGTASLRPRVTVEYDLPSGIHDRALPAVSSTAPERDGMVFDIRGRKSTAAGSGVYIVVNGQGAAAEKTVIIK